MPKYFIDQSHLILFPLVTWSKLAIIIVVTKLKHFNERKFLFQTTIQKNNIITIEHRVTT